MNLATKTNESWVVYTSRTEDGEAIVSFRDDLAEQIEAKLPTTLCLARISRDPDAPSKMPRHESFKAMMPIEDELAAFAAARGGAIAGRVTMHGWRLLYLYADCSEGDFVQIARDLCAENDFLIKIMVGEDPNHGTYWRELYPDEDEWGDIHIRQLLALLREHGDTLTAARDIAHWAYFSSKQSAIEYSTWLTSQGYEPEPPREPEDEAADWAVIFHHEDIPQFSMLAQRTRELRATARHFDGEYDGWETQLITS